MGGWEETLLGQVTSADHRDIPDHKLSCSVHKLRGRKRKWGIFGAVGFAFSSLCCV